MPRRARARRLPPPRVAVVVFFFLVPQKKKTTLLGRDVDIVLFSRHVVANEEAVPRTPLSRAACEREARGVAGGSGGSAEGPLRAEAELERVQAASKERLQTMEREVELYLEMTQEMKKNAGAR